MTSHTAGPWTIVSDAETRTLIIIPAMWPGEIARVQFPTIENAAKDAECNANANLLRAAPDLLDSIDPDTLEAIADEIDCFKHSARAAGLRGLAKRQRAAISKATDLKG